MTLSNEMRERIKFQLRLKFGTVFAFEDKVDLPRKSVTDFLRGRANQNVAAEIDKALGTSLQSDKADNSDRETVAHRLNAEAR